MATKIAELQIFQRAKQKQLDWDIKHNLTKINYRIDIDNIKETQVNIIFLFAALTLFHERLKNRLNSLKMN